MAGRALSSVTNAMSVLHVLDTNDQLGKDGNMGTWEFFRFNNVVF